MRPRGGNAYNFFGSCAVYWKNMSIFAAEMRKIFVWLLGLLAVALQAQNLHFHQLTVKDGLPHNSVIAIGEDSDGRLWVSTLGGLCQYDGHRIILLTDEGLPDRRADRIHCDEQGTMWVRGMSTTDRISRYDTLQHRFVTYTVKDMPDSLRQRAVRPFVRTFADDALPRVWTLEKHVLWQTDTLQPDSRIGYLGETATQAGLLDNTIHTIFLDRRGLLWVGSANNGLFFADTHQHFYHRMVFDPTPLVRACMKDHTGRLWVAICDKQLAIVGNNETTYHPVTYPMTDSVEGRRMRVLFEDSRQQIWLGTRDGLYVKPSEKEDFTLVLSGVPVYALCEDESKQLWIGTMNGLYSLQRGKRPVLTDSTLNDIRAVCYAKGSLWVATENGLYQRMAGTTICRNTMICYAVAVDSQGNLWVGTDKGLWRCQTDTDQWDCLLANHSVKSLVCLRDMLWCCYDNGLLCMNIYTLEQTELHTSYNEYIEGAVFCDYTSGRLYFGGNQGLDCFSADSLDDRLRTGVPVLWLDEQQLKYAQECKDFSFNGLWLLSFVFIVSVGFIVLFMRKRRKVVSAMSVSESTDIDTEIALSEEPSPFILQATRIVESHIADPDFSVEQFAAEMAMSRTKLFTLMKAETDKTVMEFLRDIRLSRAADLLRTDKPVSEIALACGFNDTSNFRRTFMKRFGVSPSQYRKEQGLES